MLNKKGKILIIYPHTIRKYNLKISIRQFSATIHINKKVSLRKRYLIQLN